MYDKLTIKQQAALAFNHLMAGNQSETERVIDAVPMRSYRCKDLEFQDQFESYKMVALLWSLEYWQLYAQQMEAQVRVNVHTRRRDWLKADEAHEEFLHFGACLSAIDRALQGVCEAQGINFEAVRLMAGCRSIADTASDERHQASIIQNLEGVLI